MAEAITLRLERSIPGVDLSGVYAAFGKNWDAIEEAAQEVGTLSPFDFVSETPEEYTAMMKDVKDVEKELGNFDINEIKENPEFKQILADLGNDPNVIKMLQEAKSPDELLGQVFPDESPGEEWYEAEEGLEFLRQLDEYAKQHPGKFKGAEDLRGELGQISKVLDEAQRNGVKFYFALQG